MSKIALHPGYVWSTDGDRHYVSASRLAQLYRLLPGEYIVWDINLRETYLGRNYENYIHLYPEEDGNYFDARKRFLNGI